MIRHISADYVYPVSSAPLKNGILGFDPQGKICEVLPAGAAKGIETLIQYEGVLVPGFVNTHCHLELSHLGGKINEGTGLTTFIKGILDMREQPEATIDEAMRKADAQMYANGIVAVGDIANKIISKSVKQKSKLYYHTFIELFGFNRPTAPVIAAGIQLKKDFYPLKASLVPHAPYSVSASLFEQISANTLTDDILSIHNQETSGENELFESGTGTFADFFAEMGIAQSEAHRGGKNAIYYHLPKLAKAVNTLLVHNTFTKKTDLDFAEEVHPNVYWCLCPNANIYIENNLPDVKLFRETGIRTTLGTDSLASNHQLSILAEMYTLQEEKNVPFDELLRWGTLNGAMFLNIGSQYGSFEVGKQPGIVLLQGMDAGKITANTLIKRLI